MSPRSAAEQSGKHWPGYLCDELVHDEKGLMGCAPTSEGDWLIFFWGGGRIQTSLAPVVLYSIFISLGIGIGSAQVY